MSSRRRSIAPRPVPSRVRPAWWDRALIPLALSLAMLAIYGRIVGHDFVSWDDQGHVTENPHLDPVTLAGVVRLWKQPFFEHYVPLSYTGFAAQAWLAQSSHDQYGKL